jgi:hypothetical protein
MPNELAPAGQVWVCGACGKRSRTKYGFYDDGGQSSSIDYGWDESCMMNAVLCDEEDLIFGEDGRVRALKSLTHAANIQQ